MSTILTEPVKDTVKDYEEMKKLIVPRSLGMYHVEIVMLWIAGRYSIRGDRELKLVREVHGEEKER